MGRLRTSLAVTTVAAAISLVPAGSASAKRCAGNGVTISGVIAIHTTCSNARRIAGDTIQRCNAPPCRIDGYHCRRLTGGQLGGEWRCTRGRRIVRFSFGD